MGHLSAGMKTNKRLQPLQYRVLDTIVRHHELIVTTIMELGAYAAAFADADNNEILFYVVKIMIRPLPLTCEAPVAISKLTVQSTCLMPGGYCRSDCSIAEQIACLARLSLC
jgi:hypothetical protein